MDHIIWFKAIGGIISLSGTIFILFHLVKIFVGWHFLREGYVDNLYVTDY